MFDGYSKENLKKAVSNLTAQADTTTLVHELAAVARALLLEEIAKRPDDPKPEEPPPEKPEPATADADDEVSLTKGKRR